MRIPTYHDFTQHDNGCVAGDGHPVVNRCLQRVMRRMDRSKPLAREDRQFKMIHVRTTIAIGFTFVLMQPETAGARVDGFSESFSGQGEYASIGIGHNGLDEPGWGIYGNSELTDEGLAFDLETRFPDDVEYVSIERDVIGSGSYRSEVQLSDLQFNRKMSPNDDVTSMHISVAHSLVDDGGPLVNALVAVFGANTLTLAVSAPSTDGITRDRLTFPRGDVVSIGMSYDEELLRVVGNVDVIIDGTNQTFELSVPTALPLMSTSSVELRAQSTGLNDVSGIVNSWTMVSVSGLIGDFNGNGMLDVSDLEQLRSAVSVGGEIATFDVDGDSVLSTEDVKFWLHDLKNSYFGDANLDGEFASSDLVNVFAAGQYEDDIFANSTWSTGDWDGDGDFTTSDLVFAFQDGGYEQGPRVSMVVPEPTGLAGVWLGLAAIACLRRQRRIGE